MSNSAGLLTGSSFSKAVSIISTGLIASQLGPSDFGTFALMMSGAAIVRTLANINAWQAVIAFAGDVPTTETAGRFGAIVRFSVICDVVAHALVGLLLVAGVLIAWDQFAQTSTVKKTLGLFLVLPLLADAVNSTASGVLRIFKRFSVIAFAPALESAALIIAVVYLNYVGADIESYILSSLVASMIPPVAITLFAVRCLSDQAISLHTKRVDHMDRQSRISFLRYIIATNVNSSIALVTRQFDMIIVGSLIGSAGAGIYRVVKLAVAIPELLHGSLYTAIYPQIAQLQTSRNFPALNRFAIQSSLLAFFLVSVYLTAFYLVGDTIIKFAFGNNYADAYHNSIIYISGYVILALCLPLNPILLAAKRPTVTMLAHSTAAVVFVLACLRLVPSCGVTGACISFVAYSITWGLVMLPSVKTRSSKS